ncbi:HlyD family type I secretion periplasmic adaptor subunit [Sphingomonas baiyangensis]|uniref:Membrane fusion protein (MFP) family protein n=1 Tax=Sphingomonas baiyangensis TaxID=2572576 RepID=A0A4U1L6J5_9SPHN|nr:HlyD family type I secretion periplasmic adaptor subunit [Sphingomonas baiyangensis]TKD52244.1 HlyD family type I secretion periplasmic adaptor subunit [Sphingomonas baiyangensis]
METTIAPREQGRIEDAVPIKPKAASNLLLWLITAFFVAFVAWAALTEIDRTVRATGRIIPGSRLQVVSNLEGGVVEAILARAGEEVKRGQPLIRLDPTRTGAELGSSELSVSALTAKIARLEAEVQGRAPRYPVSQDAAVNEQIAIERSLHMSRMADLASSTAAAQSRITQTQRAVGEAQAAYESRASSLRSLEQQADLMRPLVERGIEPRLTLVQLENNASVARSDMAAAQAAIARAQAGVAEAQSSLNQLRQDWRARAASELAAAQAEMAAKRRVLPALADAVRRSTLTAPMDGRINRVLVSTVGGTVAPGAPLVELVPSEDQLLVEAQVAPKDIGFVRIRQPAKINVSAYDSAIYGSMDGEVETISPDAVIDERTGESHYIVRVRANSETLTGPDGRPLDLGSGMTVDVSLLGDKRSVLSYVLTPITRLQQRAFRE